MAKLRNIKPMVGKLPPIIRTQSGDETQRSRFRDDTQAHRRWYKTSRWQKLRWSVLVRDLFTCQMCKRVEADTSQLVGDHIKPHRGDERMFWDEGNIQCVCKQCHDSEKQRFEKSRRSR